LAAFVAFGFLRFLFFKTGLDNTKGHGREFQSREQYLKDIGLELDQSYKPSGNESQTTKTSFDNSIELEHM